MTLEIRAAEKLQDVDLTYTNDTGATFRATAVPYNTWTTLFPGMREMFKPGALHASEAGIKLRLEHEETIGVITEFSQDDDGAYITGRISATRAGNDAVQLLKDGALTAVSIGFLPDANGTQITYDDAGNADVVRTSAELIEVSLVSFPAYQGAQINEIRSKQEKEANRMENPSATEIAELRAAVNELDRNVKLMNTATEPEPNPLALFRNAGEYYKALAAGDDLAKRAFDENAVVLDDTAPRPAWLNRTLDLMDEKMRLTNIFTHTKDLPKEGNALEYPIIAANTIHVAEQANEGDTLAQGKISFTTASAEVKTYGGFSRVSRQFVERANAAFLAPLHRAQAIAYATAIENATVATFKTLLAAQSAAPKVTANTTLAEMTAETLADVVIDLVDYYEESIIYPFEGIIVSHDVFKLLAKLDEIPKALQFVGAPTDKVGTLNVAKQDGSTIGVNVVRAPRSAGTQFFAGYSSQAIEIKEDGRAPMRLTDEDITNLTNLFSVYGYAAHLTPAPDALVPVGFAAAAE